MKNTESAHFIAKPLLHSKCKLNTLLSQTMNSSFETQAKHMSKSNLSFS